MNRRAAEPLRHLALQPVKDPTPSSTCTRFCRFAIFAKFWITNRNQRKGISERKLIQELSKKGISREIIRTTLAEGIRDDKSELQKIIVKKSSKYDNQKLFKYLLSKGFNYDDIKEALADLNN